MEREGRHAQVGITMQRRQYHPVYISEGGIRHPYLPLLSHHQHHHPDIHHQLSLRQLSSLQSSLASFKQTNPNHSTLQPPSKTTAKMQLSNILLLLAPLAATALPTSLLTPRTCPSVFPDATTQFHLANYPAQSIYTTRTSPPPISQPPPTDRY